MQKPYGHTLPEIMTCLLISSLLASLALPSFSSLLQNNQKTQQTNTLLGLLHFARNTAVMTKSTVSLCAGKTQCNQSNRWVESLLVFLDNNSNGMLDEGETLLRQADLNNSYSWQWLSFRKRYYLTYEKNGTTQALNGTFTLCTAGQALHQVVISLSGRIRSQVATNAPEACH